MKSKSIKIIALLIVSCLALTLTLTACGKKPQDANAQINAFIEAEKDQLDAFSNSMSDTFEMKVEARGSSLVYVYKFKTDLPGNNEEMAQALDSSLDAMSSTFKTVLTSLQKEVPGATSVIVEYIDKNGTIITTKEFK